MITAAIIAKNEQSQIKECIESLAWCQEIIVVDDDSSDKTASIARASGARVYQRSLNGDFATQRNFALSKSSNDWVIFVDADERVSKQLRDEIQSMLYAFSHPYEGFLINRQDTLWQKKLQYGEVGNKQLIRIGKKTSGQWIGRVHEAWDVSGKIGTLKQPLNHFPHQTISEFLQEINYYTDIRASLLYEKQITTNIFLIFGYPLAKFIKLYLFAQGFRDGMPGLIVAIMMSFHSYLVRSKLWMLHHEGK